MFQSSSVGLAPRLVKPAYNMSLALLSILLCMLNQRHFTESTFFALFLQADLLVCDINNHPNVVREVSSGPHRA
jgi:hypothetical protein